MNSRVRLSLLFVCLHCFLSVCLCVRVCARVLMYMRQCVALESVSHARKTGKEGAKSLAKFTLVIGNTVQVLAEKDPSVRRGAQRIVLFSFFLSLVF